MHSTFSNTANSAAGNFRVCHVLEAFFAWSELPVGVDGGRGGESSDSSRVRDRFGGQAWRTINVVDEHVGARDEAL